MPAPSYRTVLLKLHLWAGMMAALFLFALGLSGAVIVFENEIDGFLNSHLAFVRPQGVRLTLAEIEKTIRQQYPNGRIEGFELPQAANRSLWVYVENGEKQIALAVNPYNADVLGTGDQQNRFTGKVHQFHTHLLLPGRTGHIIITTAAFFLFALAVTGLVLWWPRKIFRVRSGSTQRVVFDTHQMLGLWSSLFVLLFSLTGIAIGFEDQVNRWARSVSHAQEQRRATPSIPKPDAQPLSPDQLLAEAETLAPGAHATILDLGDSPRSPALIVMKVPEDHTPAGRTRLRIDRYSGQVLRFENARSMPAPMKYASMWNREIHTGDIFGWPTRILACLFSLIVPTLAVTGPWIWWNRTRSQRSRAVTSMD